VLHSETHFDAFRDFVADNEARLRQALSATLGTQVGREAAADALGYAWGELEDNHRRR
jgi:hypothetical protein